MARLAECDGCRREADPATLVLRHIAAPLGQTAVWCHDSPGCWAAALHNRGGGRYVTLSEPSGPKRRSR